MSTFKNLFYKSCEENHLIGANIVVCDNNNVLEKFSYGYQDIEKGIESSADTVYRIASISKTVGAIGLMQLVEKGLVDLNEDISKYLGFKVVNPSFPNDKITVKMLLLQTSSIQDGYDDENPAYDNIIKGYNGINGTLLDVSLKTLLTDTSSVYYTPFTFGNYKPGSKFCYSNFGCGIMACIIELVSGELYVDYMENHIFKPLGLNASFKASRIKNYDYIASMYYKTKTELRKVSKERFTESKLPVFPLGNNYRGPAGGLFISMTDLSIIMRMFLNYGTYEGIQILKRETVEMMYQEEWLGKPADEYRAKGLQMRIQKDNGIIPLRGHSGCAYGVRSYMYFNLKYKIGACFITNGFDSYPDSLPCKKVFYETQKAWVSEYSHYMPSKVTILNDKIELKERTINHSNLFLDYDNTFILGKALADALELLPTYDENKMTLEFVIDDKHININTLILYQDELYVNIKEVLNKLNISYQIDKDNRFTISL